jgi:heme/copper-type cytochrome/quinol oxidase subunit 2
VSGLFSPRGATKPLLCLSVVLWLALAGLTLAAAPAWADVVKPEGDRHWGITAAMVLMGLVVVLVVIFSGSSLRRIAASRMARRAAEREAEEDRLRSGDDQQ